MRGVRVPPGWARKAIKTINEIVGRMVNRDVYKGEVEAHGVAGALLAEKSVCEAMSIFHRQRLRHQPRSGRQLRPRCHSKQAVRLQ